MGSTIWDQCPEGSRRNRAAAPYSPPLCSHVAPPSKPTPTYWAVSCSAPEEGICYSCLCVCYSHAWAIYLLHNNPMGLGPPLKGSSYQGFWKAAFLSSAS
jgi:hypothetical protein